MSWDESLDGERCRNVKTVNITHHFKKNNGGSFDLCLPLLYVLCFSRLIQHFFRERLFHDHGLKSATRVPR